MQKEYYIRQSAQRDSQIGTAGAGLCAGEGASTAVW